MNESKWSVGLIMKVKSRAPVPHPTRSTTPRSSLQNILPQCFMLRRFVCFASRTRTDPRLSYFFFLSSLYFCYGSKFDHTHFSVPTFLFKYLKHFLPNEIIWSKCALKKVCKKFLQNFFFFFWLVLSNVIAAEFATCTFSIVYLWTLHSNFILSLLW